MTLAALPRLYRAHYGDMTGSTSERDRYSHVVALIRRFREYRGHSAGTPRREFLDVDELADACILLMKRNLESILIQSDVLGSFCRGSARRGFF